MVLEKSNTICSLSLFGLSFNDFLLCQVHERVYDDVDRKSLYHLLESTRHYGGMLYFLVSHKRINGLLIRMMSEER